MSTPNGFWEYSKDESLMADVLLGHRRSAGPLPHKVLCAYQPDVSHKANVAPSRSPCQLLNNWKVRVSGGKIAPHKR